MANIDAEPDINVNEKNDDCVVCSLFLVVAEPLNVEQKDLILERIVTELSNWDSAQSGCDLSQQVQSIQSFLPTAQDGGLIFKTELSNLKITTLINANVEMVTSELHEFLLTPSKYMFLLHSGPVFMNSGAWLLSDGVFTFQNFCQVLKKTPVMEALVKPPETLIDLSFVRPFTEWTDASFAKINPKLKIRLSRPTRTLSDESGLIKFSDHLSTFLSTPSISDRLQSAPPSGSITFDQPTAYIFPAGQGDCFLFGVTGFTILIDGGYNKTSCFHNLVRHLVRLDAVIMTRLSADNTLGLSSFFEKQALEKLKPVLGTVMLNIGDARHKVAPSEGVEEPRITSGLVVSLAEEGRLMAEHLSLFQLTPSAGLGFSFTNLYYKVGHGSLDMYVLSPHLDSKEFKDFLQSWSKSVDSYKGGVPVSDNLSISCVLLWKPAANLKEPIVRMLFPGRIPAAKLAEGLEKLKSVVCFQTRTGVATFKKPSQAVKQATGAVRMVGRKENSVAKAPSSVSLDKSIRNASADVKKTTAPKKALNAKFPTKPEAGDLKDGKEATKSSKLADAKPARKPTEPMVTSTPLKNASQKTSRLKAVGTVEKKEVAKQPAKPLSDKQAPIAKKSPKPAASKPAVAQASKASEVPKAPSKTDKKVPEKAKLPKSAEKKKVTDKGKVPVKKELQNGGKTPEKQEATDDKKSSEAEKSPGNGHASALEDFAVEVKQEVADGVEGVVGDLVLMDGLKDPLSEKEREKVDEDKEVEESHVTDSVQSPLDQFDPLKEWEEPLKLPSPAKDASDDKSPSTKPLKKPASHEDVKVAPRKQEVRKAPLKPVTAFHVDLAYIPSHADVDFFRRVKSSYYVLSSSTPDPCILPNLIEARSTWDDSESWEVLVVPTHQSQVLLSWLATLNDRLLAANIKVTPPASRCSVAVREPDLACDAYRIPFI